jgi:FKBP-type peptidyl-prolyl cis-trans isomerase 2/predicted Fe-Mo cluster-binding NifX family protein
MRIAVTYNNGEVFQHFGHTEEFKVYEVEDKKVKSSEVIGSNGSGHGALAGLLAGESIDVLICGGLGGGAYTALTDNGIEVIAGASGSADEAVEAYLRGELESTGVNCDHHDHEEGHSCGDHGCGGHDEEEGGCGSCGDDEEGGCAGGCGGCHGCHSEPLFEGKNVGKVCRVHYKGTYNDGTQFDSSYDRGEPLEFVCGMGMMILGFDKAVAEMEVGDVIDVHLTAEEAYGEVDPNAIFSLDIAELPGSESCTVGQRVYLQDNFGRPIPVKVTAKDDTKITFDANHEMAGKELNFNIKLVEIAEQ